MRDHRFEILGFRVGLRGPAERLEPIRSAYRRFERPEVEPEVQLTFEPGPPAVMTVGAAPVSLVEGLDPTLQLYQRFLTAVMDGVGTHAILHGASLLGPDGGVTLIAAPSGYGKSSLSLELAARGHGFLGDDYAPLELATGRVAPYPRAVGLVPGGAAPLPDAFRAAAGRPGAPRLFGKVLVDVGEALGERAMVRAPAPLRRVVLLTASGEAAPGDQATRVRVATRSDDAGAFAERLAGIDGVEIVARGEREGVSHWMLRLDHAHHPTAAVAPLLDDERVLYCEKHWDGRPDFASRPSAEPLSRSETARWVGRELLNRRARGRLLAGYGGRLPGLYLDLASALRRADCWRVRVGRSAETADLIEALATDETGNEPEGEAGARV